MSKGCGMQPADLRDTVVGMWWWHLNLNAPFCLLGSHTQAAPDAWVHHRVCASEPLRNIPGGPWSRCVKQALLKHLSGGGWREHKGEVEHSYPHGMRGVGTPLQLDIYVVPDITCDPHGTCLRRGQQPAL